MRALTLLAILAITSAACGTAPPSRGATGAAPWTGEVVAPPAVWETKRAGLLNDYAKLPLSFVPNVGHLNAAVRYYAQAAGFSVAFGGGEALLALIDGQGKGVALALRFEGANPTIAPQGRQRLSGTVNYLRGSDPAAWQTDLPTYGEVVYPNLWPGIDLAFRGGAGQLKYEFIVAPGADVSAIRLVYRGAHGISLDPAGDLRIATALGALTDTRPVSYELDGSTRVPVETWFVLYEGNAYGFALGPRGDSRLPLVIDPGLVYSTYLGGALRERAFAIAVDRDGNAYVTGRTESVDFPTTPGAFDTTQNGSFDVFVAKLNPAGSALVYSTYLGGSQNDQGFGIAVDSSGNAYVTGVTESADFPTTPGAFDVTYNGNDPRCVPDPGSPCVADAFVTKLNASGSRLVYSTYLGGARHDEGTAIAVDSAGNAYVTGWTGSGIDIDPLNFPTTAGAFDTTYNGSGDAFVTKLNPAGSALVYSTFLGGGPFGDGIHGHDRGRAIAVDSAGNAYVTGQTRSASFPTTPGAFDTTQNSVGVEDAFVTKLNATGSALIYSTYLGGSLYDEGFGIAVDSSGNAYVTGVTRSTDFPTMAGAFRTTHSGSDDAFVTKLNATGSALVYSTYLGGTLDDDAFAIAVDSAGNAYVTGGTESTDFPTTAGAFDTTHNGLADVFVTKLNVAGSTLAYSTYLGGTGSEAARAIAVDPSGNVYVAGSTGSTDFPTTPGAFDTTHNGAADAFVAKLALVLAPATLALSPKVATNTTGSQHCVTAIVKDALGTPTPGITVRFSVSGSDNLSGSATTDASGHATFCYTVSELPGADAIHAFTDTNGNGAQDPGEPFDDASKLIVFPASTLGCKVTQGGSIMATNGDEATFGGNAKFEGTASGVEEYQDHGPATSINVHSINVLAVVCSPDRRRATVFGRATVNGTGSHLYRIDVKDLGEPGRNDTYRILLSTGYDSGERPLTGGNVQIR